MSVFIIRRLLQSLLVFAVLCLPGLPHWLSPAGRARADFLLDPPSSWPGQYLSYLSPEFLLLSGDENLRHSMEGWGQLYLFALLTVPLGLLALRGRSEAARLLR